MTLSEKQMALKAELVRIKDGQERFAYVVARGRRQPVLEAALKRDEFLVDGCLSKLWVVPQFREDKCYFQADSDSAIVKGITTLICEFYSGSTPEEILEHDSSFFAELGIAQHLTTNRRSSLSQVMGKIRTFARTHMTLKAAPSS